MSRYCQVTGRGPSFGNKVSHAHNKSRRRFDLNLFKKKFWIREEGRFIRLRVSAKGIRIIDKKGLSKVMREMRARGEKV